MNHRIVLALAALCVSPQADADELTDLSPALTAGFSLSSSRTLRAPDALARGTCSLRNRDGVTLSVEVGHWRRMETPDPRWRRFWEGMQNPPNTIPDHFGSTRLGQFSYAFHREGVTGWRILAILRTASVEVILGLAETREGRRIIYQPNDVEADWLIMRQVAARTLANIAARELEDASADPATGAGRYARPDGVRFVELTPWAKAKGYAARLNDDGISVTLTKADRTVLVNLASKDAMVDGAKRTLAECPLWKKGRFLVAETDLAKLF